MADTTTTTVQAPRDESTEVSPPPSRRRGIIIAVVVILVLVGLGFWWHSTYYEDTDDAQINGHLIQISSRIAGQVIHVDVDENQVVKKGDPIAELDPRDYQVAVENAQAALESAKAAAAAANVNVPITTINTGSTLSSAGADVSAATASISQAQSQVAAAHAQVVQAEANALKAQQDLDRYKPLVEKDVISKQQYDAAVAAANAAKAAVESAHANERAAQDAVRVANEKASAAQAQYKSAQSGPQQVAAQSARAKQALAQVAVAQAQLDQANLNLSYTKIVAPVSGEVTKTVVPGMNVQPGQQLLTVVPLDDVWVTANFKETQLRHIRPGQRAQVYVDSTGRTYRGRVDSIAGATGPLFSLFPPENATGNYVKIVQRVPVKIVIEPGQNADRQLRPGVNVTPKVFLR